MAAIKLPALVEVDDYHEFSYIESVLAQFGVKCKHTEVGFAEKYMAVFYNTSKSDPKVKKLIIKGKKIAQDFDDIEER